MFCRFSISICIPWIQTWASSADEATRSKFPRRPRNTSVKQHSGGNSSGILRNTSDWWPSRTTSTSPTETEGIAHLHLLLCLSKFSWADEGYFSSIQQLEPRRTENLLISNRNLLLKRKLSIAYSCMFNHSNKTYRCHTVHSKIRMGFYNPQFTLQFVGWLVHL